MKPPDTSSFSELIIQKAQSFPGVLAGIVGIHALKNAPSYLAHTWPDRNSATSYPTYSDKNWPEKEKSVLVLALSHPATDLQMDWWDGKGTAGNRILMSVSENMKIWMMTFFEINAQVLPYYVESGGIFLKDAAVLAGLGVMGKNNLLVTPEFGPRVRLRALLLDIELMPTGPMEDFSPCNGCDMPCGRACAQNAFAQDKYSREICMIQMQSDQIPTMASKNSFNEEKKNDFVAFCRACELFCIAKEHKNEFVR